MAVDEVHDLSLSTVVALKFICNIHRVEIVKTYISKLNENQYSPNLPLGQRFADQGQV